MDTRAAGRRIVLAIVAMVATACSLVIGAGGISDGTPDADGGDRGARGPDGDDAPPLDASDAGAASDAFADASADGSCVLIVAPGDAGVCTTIPAFVGVQSVDGVGDEFCNVPATTFVVAQGLVPLSPENASKVTTVAYLRTAWSALGIHLHAHVDQAVVNPPPLGYPPAGDALEVFVSPSSLLHGYIGPGFDVGAQVISGAPAVAQPPFSETAAYPSDASVVLDGGQFAARRVDGGYELELQIRWADIAAYAQAPTIVPSAGSTIAIDFSYDVGDGSGGRLFQSTFAIQRSSDDSGCPVVPGVPGADFPFCDDRTWCTPTLAAP